MDEVMPNQADQRPELRRAPERNAEQLLLRTQYLEARNRVLARENAAFREEIGRKNQALKAVKRQLRELRSSRSWRLTRPVRATGRAVRRMKRGPS